MDQVDGRTLKPKGRNELRRLVIRLRQQSGMKGEELAQSSQLKPDTTDIAVVGW